MSDTTQVTVEEVKVQVETVAAALVPDALKAQLEVIIKAAIKELLEELKKGPLAALDKNGDGVVTATEVKAAAVAALDKNGDGVVTATEVKEVAVAAAKKWCC